MKAGDRVRLVWKGYGLPISLNQATATIKRVCNGRRSVIIHECTADNAERRVLVKELVVIEEGVRK